MLENFLDESFFFSIGILICFLKKKHFSLLQNLPAEVPFNSKESFDVCGKIDFITPYMYICIFLYIILFFSICILCIKKNNLFFSAFMTAAFLLLISVEVVPNFDTSQCSYIACWQSLIID